MHVFVLRSSPVPLHNVAWKRHRMERSPGCVCVCLCVCVCVPVCLSVCLCAHVVCACAQHRGLVGRQASSPAGADVRVEKMAWGSENFALTALRNGAGSLSPWAKSGIWSDGPIHPLPAPETGPNSCCFLQATMRCFSRSCPAATGSSWMRARWTP